MRARGNAAFGSGCVSWRSSAPPFAPNASVGVPVRRVPAPDDDHEGRASSAFLRVAIRQQACARHCLVRWGSGGVASTD